MNEAISARYVDYGCYAMCAMLVASPLFFPREGRRYSAVPVAIGAMGLLSRLMVGLCGSVEERNVFRPSHELSEAVGGLT